MQLIEVGAREKLIGQHPHTLYNQTSVALAILWWIINKTELKNQTSWFKYQDYMFVDSSTKYIGPPNYVHYIVWKNW